MSSLVGIVKVIVINKIINFIFQRVNRLTYRLITKKALVIALLLLYLRMYLTYVGSESPNIYRRLDLSVSADSTDIRRGYREMSIRFHPDKDPNNSEKYLQFSEMYRVLQKEEYKWIYDRFRVSKRDLERNVQMKDLLISSYITMMFEIFNNFVLIMILGLSRQEFLLKEVLISFFGLVLFLHYVLFVMDSRYARVVSLIFGEVTFGELASAIWNNFLLLITFIECYVYSFSKKETLALEMRLKQMRAWAQEKLETNA